MPLKRLIESFSHWDSSEKIEAIPLKLSEKTLKLEENSYPILGAYKIPVWRLTSPQSGENPNRNKRKYTRELAEKIIRSPRIKIIVHFFKSIFPPPFS